MDKDIELLRELKGRLVEKMVVESRRQLLNTNAINKCGEYISALSNAIQLMKEAVFGGPKAEGVGVEEDL